MEAGTARCPIGGILKTWWLKGNPGFEGPEADLDVGFWMRLMRLGHARSDGRQSACNGSQGARIGVHGIC